MKNYSKILVRGLLLSLLMLLMACGTTETTKISDSANAMSKIREYARTDGKTVEPQIKDYNDATVRGVDNNETLIKINNVLKEDDVGADEIQEPTDIQTLLYERDILDIPASSETSLPTIPASVPTPVATPTPTPVVTPTPTPTPVVTPTPTPTPVVTPTPTPKETNPPIESDFKIEDKNTKADIALTLEGEGNVTIEIGEEFDYENGYKVKEGGSAYLFDKNGTLTGYNGETMDINASDYLDNKDEAGTYVIYYTLVDKKKKELLRVWRLVSVIDGDTPLSSQTTIPTSIPTTIPTSSPTSSPTTTPTPTPTSSSVPLDKTVNITDIKLELKYNATFTSGSKSKPIFTEIQWADPGYYFINKKNGKTLHIITMETKQIMGTQYIPQTVIEANGTTSIKMVPKKVVAGYDTKYGVSYNNKTINFNEYNKSKGNIGITIVDENGNDVTNYLWQNLSIDDDHNNGSTIGFVVPTDGYIAMPYVLNRKGQMTNQYVFNNYEDKYKNKTDAELKDINQVAKTPYAYVIRYIKAIRQSTPTPTPTPTPTSSKVP